MMMETVDDVRRFVLDNHVSEVDLKFCDLAGRLHHVTLPARHVEGSLFEKGVGFDGSSVAGFTRLESGDLAIIPDPTTAFMDPFTQSPTLSMLCNVVEADTRAPFPRDPRGIARRAEAHLKDSGIGDESRWGPEFEYYVFDRVDVENSACVFGVEIVPDEPENRFHAMPRGCGYHAIPPLDRHHDLRSRTVQYLEDAGISVLYHHHEVGPKGQCEIEIERIPLLRAGDVTLLVKHFVRLAATQNGQVATFMPKPLYGEAGSGMHFHQHLFKGNAPLFHDEGGYAGLSKTALHYVAGVLHHGRALSALTNPSTNSFRRLVPGYEAPVNLFFSQGNRSAAIRVPKYADTPDQKRIEFRSPDGTCNPYIAMAAQLMAGIDGIKRELDPMAMGYGPFDEDVFRWTAERRRSITPLPEDLDEALCALEEDNDFLLAGDVFTEDFIRSFVQTKREAEILPLLRRPHPFEVELYFDV